MGDVLRAWRLEFAQAEGSRHGWLGPYTSQWLTAEAEELVRYMDCEHTVTRPHPLTDAQFAEHRAAGDPLLCGCRDEASLVAWFGPWLPLLQEQGGHVAVYDVPRSAVVVDDGQQLVFRQRAARLLSRVGVPPPTPPARSSAGPGRTEAVAASGGRYEYRPGDAGRPRPGSLLPAVRVVHLPARVLDALAVGDLPAADAGSPVPLGEYCAGPDWRDVWRMRGEQVRRDPASAAWVTGVVWSHDLRLVVGRAGFHGPPDGAGTVEIGYAVDPAHRRRGFARAALEALLRRAHDEPAVRTVRVSVAPDNTASSGLVAQYGFTAVGEQWDDVDGLEIVHERST